MRSASIQPAVVANVLSDSIAAEVGFEPGDRLVSINGEQPRDLIDYRFLCSDEYLTLEVLDATGSPHTVDIEKDFDEELGLEFESALFDSLIQCNNRCPFCFIDQQPPGKRETLYLKDDDYRLSFLYGSYLTLTNLTSPEWDRIARLRLSPLYVSVHATEPDVRQRLLKNPRAGLIMEQLRWFEDQRLQAHCQVVVCPGINDGSHLEKTLRDLASLHRGELPAVASIAVVPVGLTRFRPAQDELVPVTTAMANQVIDQVEALQQEFRETYGATVAWLADEWFLIARRSLPSESHYEAYPQIGNGVGSIRLFLKQFEQAAQRLPDRLESPRHLTWVVGNAVEHAFAPIVERLNRVEGLTVTMAALRSQYWGQEITVTGLLTGYDILENLMAKDLHDGIVLPSLMLKRGELASAEETYFLDDMTLASLARKLQCAIATVSDVDSLIEACTANLETHPAWSQGMSA